MKSEIKESPETISSDELLERSWNFPGSPIQIDENFNLVKIFDKEFRVKERTIAALNLLLSQGIKNQTTCKAPPTKEDFLSACGLHDRNEREFKVIKELFHYPELRKIIKYDRQRKGYYLDIDLNLNNQIA